MLYVSHVTFYANKLDEFFVSDTPRAYGHEHSLRIAKALRDVGHKAKRIKSPVGWQVAFLT